MIRLFSSGLGIYYGRSFVRKAGSTNVTCSIYSEDSMRLISYQTLSTQETKIKLSMTEVLDIAKRSFSIDT